MPTRRHFLKSSGAGVLAASTLSAQQSGVSPNDRIRFALIGGGGMGNADVRSALAAGGTELVAVADVYDGRLVRAKEEYGNQILTTRDYR
jgi:threonine dehydrogenase-like Zn-dependent dehydrogenase